MIVDEVVDEEIVLDCDASVADTCSSIYGIVSEWLGVCSSNIRGE